MRVLNSVVHSFLFEGVKIVQSAWEKRPVSEYFIPQKGQALSGIQFPGGIY